MSSPRGEYHAHISNMVDATNIAAELQKLSGELLNAAAALEEAINPNATLQTDIDAEIASGQGVTTSLGESQQTMGGTAIISPMNSLVIDGLARFSQAGTSLELGGISLSSAKDEANQHAVTVTTIISELRAAAGEARTLMSLLGTVGSQALQAQGMTKE